MAVAVFCGSRIGQDPAYRDAAVLLGRGLAASGIRLIYGGGRVGMMGALADAALAGGGMVTGVIPDFLVQLELAHRGVTSLILTETLHSRKKEMLALCDIIVALPGGFGTFDELIEVITWRLLGLHEKPVFICDINGWAKPLVSLFHSVESSGFCATEAQAAWEVLPGVVALLQRLQNIMLVRPAG